MNNSESMKGNLKTQVTSGELEALVLAELRSMPDCEGVVKVTVIPYSDFRVSANWEVASFDPGASDWSCCELAMCAIVERLQQRFDLCADKQLR
jgi:hypothetical protein